MVTARCKRLWLLVAGVAVLPFVFLLLFPPQMAAPVYLPLEAALRWPRSVPGLFLGRPDLVQVPEEVRRLRNLRKIWIQDTQIEDLPAWLTENTEIDTIKWVSNRLSRFPPELLGMTRLTELILVRNEITELPTSIGKMTSLRRLYLNVNKLTRLPAQVGHLQTLTELGLSDNRLTELPGEIGALTNLELLNVSDNQLTHLPPEIGRLWKLAELEVQDNRLADFPEEIAGLTSLKYLKVQGNPLSAKARARLPQLLPHTEIQFDEVDATKPDGSRDAKKQQSLGSDGERGKEETK